MNTAFHAIDDTSSTSQRECFQNAQVHDSGGQLSAQEELDSLQNARLITSAEASTSGQNNSTLSDTCRSRYPAHRWASVPSFVLCQGRLAFNPCLNRELTFHLSQGSVLRSHRDPAVPSRGPVFRGGAGARLAREYSELRQACDAVCLTSCQHSMRLQALGPSNMSPGLCR